MPSDPNIYVFLSADRGTVGLTVVADGSNLPSTDSATGWMHYDVIPMTMNYLSRYTDEPDLAHAGLNTRGFHLSRTSGNIILFPNAHRSSS